MREIVSEQRTHEWHEARLGKVTGSVLDRALKPGTQDTLMYEIVTGMMTELIIDDLIVPAVMHGLEMEPFAIERASVDKGINFKKAGFFVSNNIKKFGLSPDCVEWKDGKVIGGVEIKAPHTKTHLQYISSGIIPKNYYHQVIAPFVASDDVQYWYFMSYDDRCYERPTFYKKMVREEVEEDVIKIRKTLITFLEKVEKKYRELTF